jgi:hypothetical protein
MRQGQEGHGDATGWSCAGSKPESGSRASVGSPIDTASPTVKCGGDGSVAVFSAEGEAKGDGDLVSLREAAVGPKDGAVRPARRAVEGCPGGVGGGRNSRLREPPLAGHAPGSWLCVGPKDG